MLPSSFFVLLFVVAFVNLGFALEATEDEETVRACVRDLKTDENSTYIEIIKACLNLSEEALKCLTARPPADHDMLYIVGLDCVPGIPPIFKDILFRIKNEEMDADELDEAVSEKYESLTEEQQSVMESREGVRFIDSMLIGSPKLIRFSKKFKVPLDYLVTVYNYVKADDKLQSSMVELDKMEKAMADGAEKDALQMFYAITNISSM